MLETASGLRLVWNATAQAAFTRGASNPRSIPMKAILTVIALSIAVSVAAPAFAQTTKAKTQAECEKMQGSRWDPNSKTCLPK